MDPFLNEFNELLTTAYRNIIKVEELMLRQFSNDQLSISELHMLESIAKQQKSGATVTDIAQDLDITLPSVTMMVKRLEKKGYLTKYRSEKDARRVQIMLTQDGRRAEISHRYFHRRMVRAITADLDNAECDAMISGLRKINGFLQMSLTEFLQGKEDEEEE